MNKDMVHIQMTLPDRLQTILEKQVQTVKNGNIRQLEALTDQTVSIIAQMAERQDTAQVPSEGQSEYIMQLYKKLELMIETQKNAVTRQLRKIESGKKTVRAYQRKL